MSVGLGTLTAIDRKSTKVIDVVASDYSADKLTLQAGYDGIQIELDLDRRQMQELSIIIDRFLDK